MRVLLINGSPRAKGNTSIALAEVAKTLEAEGIETVTLSIGAQAIRGCVACGACHTKKGKCAFSDPLYDQLQAILPEGVDGLVVGSPVYYAGPNGSLCALLDRLFYSAGAMLSYKPAAAVAVCRRGGASACFDRLNKYLPSTICLLFPHNIGIVCTDGRRGKQSKMPRACKPCVPWREIWHGCSVIWIKNNVQRVKNPK